MAEEDTWNKEGDIMGLQNTM